MPPNKEYWLDMDAIEISDFGALLRHLYYRDSWVLDLVNKRVGSPHNGGYHTLSIFGTTDDLDAFLDIVAEHAQQKYSESTWLPGALFRIHLLKEQVASLKQE
jgi:hypothetical protein